MSAPPQGSRVGRPTPIVLTGRTAALAVLGVAVAVIVPNGVAVASAAVVGLAALDAALAATPRQLRFARSGDTTVRLGTTATVTVTVLNAGSRRARGWLRDGWPPSAGAGEAAVPVDIPPGGRQTAPLTLRPTRRGDRAADRVTVRTIGPLGLAGRQRSHLVPWTVRVLPAFHARRHLPGLLSRLRDIDGRSAVRVRGAGTEFDSLREYVAGDDVRAIDWRATARATEVMVRTWQPERGRRVLVVLDTGRSSAGRIVPAPGRDAPRLDIAMDAALLLGAVAARAGDHVELLAYDRRVRAHVVRPPIGDTVRRLADALAGVEPELVETDYRRLVAHVAARAGRHSVVVLLTSVEPGPADLGLLPVIGHLTHRHAVIVASVRDPALARMASRRGDPAAVYAAAAAEHDRLTRSRIMELLIRRGAHVVDAEPDHLPPAVTGAFLSLKAAGRL